MKVRNERLYAFLRHFYKKVRVQNQGSPFQFRVAKNEDGEKRIKRISSGEEYSICCPVCRETRYRLSINHVFGERIEGAEMWHVAHCWNEDCDVSDMLKRMYEDYCELEEREFRAVDVEALAKMPTIEEIVDECEKNLVVLGGIQRVDTLNNDHVAVKYLRMRRFDPAILGPQRAIGYCFNTDDSARQAHKRIVIPILFRGRYVGWQARAIPGHTKLTIRKGSEAKKWPYAQPKYWTSTGTRMSYFLYSYDLAATQESVVVSEGPTDAWRGGLLGVATMGRRISRYQRKLIAETWGERSGKILLIGDPGFDADWELNAHELEKEVGDKGKVRLYVPKDKDPGDMTDEEYGKVLHDHLR